MFDYLQKFNSLPKNLRDSVSSPAAMSVISDLENKYKIDLAATVMKVMVKIIPLADLSIYFVSDFSLDQETAKKLTAELKERLFFTAANYLGYNPSYSLVVPKTSPAPAHFRGIEKVIKDSGVIFAGTELNSRFRNVLTTYIKGVRSRIDTRLTLSKDVVSGGLGLDYKVIDKIFKLADEVIAASLLPTGEHFSLPKPDQELTGIDKVRALYQKNDELRDIPYDLKKAISAGVIKKPEAVAAQIAVDDKKEKLLEEPVQRIMIEAATKIPLSPVVTKVVPIKINTETLKPKEENLPLASVNLTKAMSPVVVKNDLVEANSKKELIKKPIETPPRKIEIKLSEDDEILKPKIDQALPKKLVSAPVAPVTAPVAMAVEAVSGLIPVNHKITRPPEKKPGFFSKWFSKKIKDEVIEEKKPEIKSTPSTVSVASLRNEALSKDVQEKKIITNQPPVNLENKVAPRIMGPIEELTYLDLLNFRRLGQSPIEAVQKVEAKIKLLEKDGYDKMISGVVAWRTGLINSIYVKMGLESLTKGISLKQCADTYQSSRNLAYLTWDEIEQIISLNSRLMF